MNKKSSMDNSKKLTDKKKNGDKQIGGLVIELPLNRNLSERLFGQLGTLLKRNS